MRSMKLNRSGWMIFVLLAVLVPAGLSQAAAPVQTGTPSPEATDQGPSGDETISPQIFLVMDVSGSMSTRVLPPDDQLPEDVAAVVTELRKIEDSERAREITRQREELEQSVEYVTGQEAVNE